jgi:hypothetical protein
MGNYQKNLTDKAVIERVKIAQKRAGGQLTFKVHKANKKFTISTSEEKFDAKSKVHEVNGVKFVIKESKIRV